MKILGFSHLTFCTSKLADCELGNFDIIFSNIPNPIEKKIFLEKIYSHHDLYINKTGIEFIIYKPQLEIISTEPVNFSNMNNLAEITKKLDFDSMVESFLKNQYQQRFKNLDKYNIELLSYPGLKTIQLNRNGRNLNFNQKIDVPGLVSICFYVDLIETKILEQFSNKFTVPFRLNLQSGSFEIVIARIGSWNVELLQRR